MNKLKIAVVIPTFNRVLKLIQTIESILSQRYPVSAIIIVDNSTNNETFDFLYSKNLISENYIGKIKRENNIIEFFYFKMSENIGGAGAYHYGIKKAIEFEFDYIYTLDDDIICDKNAIFNIVNNPIFSNDIVFASCIISPDGKIEKIHHKIVDKYLNQKSVLPDNIRYPGEMNKNLISIDANSYAGLFISRNVAENIGLPNKEFFIWYDDFEYTYRISRKFKIYLVTNSIVIHNDSIKVINYYNLYKVYYGIRNSIILRNIYLKGFTKFLSLVIILKYYLSIILRIILREDKKFYRLKFVIYGILDGILNRFIYRYKP